MERFNPQPKPIKPDKKKPTRAPQISSQQATRLAKYVMARALYLKDHPMCEVGSCYKHSNQIHHKKGRAGKLLLDSKWFLACCTNCHRYIEDHPAWAQNSGYSVSRGQKMLGGGLAWGKFIF